MAELTEGQEELSLVGCGSQGLDSLLASTGLPCSYSLGLSVFPSAASVTTGNSPFFTAERRWKVQNMQPMHTLLQVPG